VADSDKDKENAGRVMITFMEKVEHDLCLAFLKSLKKQTLVIEDFQQASSRVTTISTMLRTAYLLPALYE
jgi:hypothetical protein